MYPVNQTLQTLQKLQLPTPNQPQTGIRPRSVDCFQCGGRGWIWVPSANASRQCECKKQKILESKLAAIPSRFRFADLQTIEGNATRHPFQPNAVQVLQNNPTESYLLAGRNGTGKTFLGWALYREALYTDRPVYGFVLAELLEEYRRAETNRDDWKPRLTAADLKQSTRKVLIFLDEFEKARPSEFAAEQLFLLLDAGYRHEHQLVITSNFRFKDLCNHWERAGASWGNSIGRRLGMCRYVEMF